MKIKKKILILAIGPVLLLGIVSMALTPYDDARFDAG